MPDTLLFIEDDRPFCEFVEFGLSRKGFQVEVAYNAMTGLQKAYALHPNAVILDIMLPDLDGWQTCAHLREMSEVPIIILTALDAEENILKGLDLGADNYLVKPVTIDELSAQIQAVLRRIRRSNFKDCHHQEGHFSYEHVMVDFDRHEVTVGGQAIYLSPIEFRLLRVLVQHKGRLLPHSFLLREVWGPAYVSKIDSLRLYICILRRKIEQDATQPHLIHNEWGIGYRFE
jgi:two-component system KDP operon response regulator KdpE